MRWLHIKYYEIAAGGWLMLLPVCFVLLLLPGGLLVMQANPSNNAREFEQIYLSYSLPLLTALAAWWPTFMLKDRLESPGRELLFVLQQKKLWMTPLFCTILYWVWMLPFMLLAPRHGLVSLYQVLLSFGLALLIAGFGFFLATTTHASIIGFIGGIFINFGVWQGLAHFASGNEPPIVFTESLAILLLCSLLFIAIGTWRLRHF